MKSGSRSELEQIPGVGKAIAEDFQNIGIYTIQDLKDLDPMVLYQKICDHEGKRVDRCMLYVCRCAVYYASNSTHDPALLKWWKWKDRQ